MIRTIISIGCVRCVSVCEAGRSVVNSGENSRSDPGFFSSLQFVSGASRFFAGRRGRDERGFSLFLAKRVI